MPGFKSALYTGAVMHHRLRPKEHRLRYSIFYLLLDLDEIDALANRLRLFSHNRFNLFSFHDRDHGEGTESPRDRIIRHLDQAGIETDGPILLLTIPRILGYAFNPLSIYFCHNQQGDLSAIFYEVNNTFGQRHSYLIPVGDADEGTVTQHCDKRLYVSPFMAMGMDYRFRIGPPGENVALHITGSDDEGPLIVASFSGKRRPLRDGTLLRAFFSYPLLTLKVVAGIHWEALLLWAKGIRLHERPAPPHRPVTHVASNSLSKGKTAPDVVG